MLSWFCSSCPVSPADGGKYDGSTSGCLRNTGDPGQSPFYSPRSHMPGKSSRSSETVSELKKKDNLIWISPDHTFQNIPLEVFLLFILMCKMQKIKPCFFTEAKNCCPESKFHIHLHRVCSSSAINRLAQLCFLSIFGSSERLINVVAMLSST